MQQLRGALKVSAAGRAARRGDSVVEAAELDAHGGAGRGHIERPHQDMGPEPARRWAAGGAHAGARDGVGADGAAAAPDVVCLVGPGS